MRIWSCQLGLLVHRNRKLSTSSSHMFIKSHKFVLVLIQRLKKLLETSTFSYSLSIRTRCLNVHSVINDAVELLVALKWKRPILNLKIANANFRPLFKSKFVVW